MSNGKKVKVGVAGYGVIGQRLADGVARQGDMELVGIADVAPTLAVRALAELGLTLRDRALLSPFSTVIADLTPEQMPEPPCLDA